MSSFDKSPTRKKTRKTKATAKKVTMIKKVTMMKTQTTATLSERPLMVSEGEEWNERISSRLQKKPWVPLPEEFRSRIQNVAILVEDFPPNQSPPQPGQRKRLLLGIFHGVPATKRSVFNLPTPDARSA
jgi:hypothetical protein